MRNRKWIVFNAGVAAAILAVAALPGSTAHAEDYCDISEVAQHHADGFAAMEKWVRQKCKVGDIVFFGWPQLIGRLCDLHQPVPGMGNNGVACFLAPPRKTY